MKVSIKEYEKLLEREKKAKFICAELNNFVDLKQTLITVIENIKILTNCEAVSIRLHYDGDYPYYVYNGFPESFIEKENSLCVKDENGNRIPSSDGKSFLLECMCGNIINAKFDSSLPFFTTKGSFWSNNTTALLASTTEDDRQSRTRNYCNSCGYESVALIPIKIKDKIIGLIQLNDMRTGMFTENLIEYLEMIAEQIGLAIDNAYQYQQILDDKNQLAKTLNELKETQKQLVERTKELTQANIKLKELDQLKSMFIASMSHELRTPLNSIIGFTDIILEGMSGEISEEQRKQLTIVKSSAKHLLALINDIIDVSKIESGKVELYIEEFDLSEIVQDVKDSFTVAADKKGLKMPLKIPERLVIKSDERRVKQIIVNLVGNAVKFTDEGKIEIKAVKNDGIIEVSVRDTGIGMRKKDMDKLFGAFSQIPIVGRTEEGTGLGLYLSKKIANLLGGEIWAKSELRRGSEFTFTLPLKYKEI